MYPSHCDQAAAPPAEEVAGPEEVLAMHPSVRSCAVVGVPHPHSGEAVKAFVVLREGMMASPALEDEIATIERYVKRREQAEKAGEVGLAIELDTVIADETRHRDELRLMLERRP